MLILPKISPPQCCKVCHAAVVVRCGEVDFNRVAVDPEPFLPMGVKVEYWQCADCGFAWSPNFDSWTEQDFSRHIYNDDIRLVETESNAIARSENIQALMGQWFSRLPSGRSLDYGCGPGILVEKLRQTGFDAIGYDRFFPGFKERPKGLFDVVTCFEVMEHINQIEETVDDIVRFLAPDGLLILGTFLTDAPMKTDWWYCAPRSGHIAFWTFRALSITFNQRKLNVASDGKVFHFVFGDAAKWKIQQIFASG